MTYSIWIQKHAIEERLGSLIRKAGAIFYGQVDYLSL